jgi:hypothetical protein
MFGQVPVWATSSATSSDSLYTLTERGIERIAQTSNGSRIEKVIAARGSVYFKVGGNEVRWLEPDGKASNPNTPLFLGDGYKPNDFRRVSGMTVTEDAIFWVDDEPLRVMSKDKSSMREVGTIKDGDRTIGFAATSTHLILNDYSNRRIVAFPKEGGPMTIVSPQDDDGFDFVGDSDGAYWTSRFKGVMAANPDGTNLRVLVDNRTAAEVKRTVDAIYYVDGENVIYRLAK